MEENIDFYWFEKDGIKYRVFTESYLYNRGFCCESDPNCTNCPYGDEKKYQSPKE